MILRIRAFLLSLTIIAVLVFSAAGTTVAYADGETPTEPAATEPAVEPVTTDTVETAEPAPVEAPGDGSAPVEEAATPLPAAEGEATPPPAEEAAPPAEEAAPATEVPVESAPVESAPVESAPAESAPAETVPAETAPPAEAPVLDAVPENTTVTVLNAEGESQPLATQAAADAIETTTDPIWCPAGQAPTPGANGCTPSFTSFTALLQHLNNNATYTGAGTIYVQAGTVQGGASVVDFNNYNLSNISNADLTITGGWNTTSGAIDPTTPSVLNNTSLIIGSSGNPWGGSLAIENLTLNNPAGTGLTLYATNDVDLANVSVTNSTNGSGAVITAGEDVTIQDSKFQRNKQSGATITAGGAVTVVRSSFSNPADARRQNIGLSIEGTGASSSVTLVDVVANENRRVGTYIKTTGFVTVVNSVFSGTKELVNSQFLGYGLTVETLSGIALDTVTANDNFLWGASLTAGEDITIANTILNANTTEDAGFIDDTGLFILDARNVSISNTHADDNRLYGAQITARGDVSISDSTFNSNNGITQGPAGENVFHGEGLDVVTSGGSITLTRVSASDNTLLGAHLDAAGDVTVTESNFNNHTTGSATDVLGRGLEIIADGSVFLDTVTLNNNQTFGANIQAGGDVFLDAVTATNNGTNGVEVQATCTTVFLINGTYTGNGQYGLSILNGTLNQSGAPVFGTNGAGDIFQNPGTCVFAPTTPPTPPTPPVEDPGTTPPTTPPTDPGTPIVTGGFQEGVTSLAGAIRNANRGGNHAFKNTGRVLTPRNVVTLTSFLATGAGNSAHIGLFTGSYAIVYFSDGSFQIVALSPSSVDGLAMAGQ